MTASSTYERSKLPSYALELAAFHHAFYPELSELVALLPLSPTDRILDVGCGDGFFAELFSKRLKHQGWIVGIDVNECLLELAHSRAARLSGPQVEFVNGDFQTYGALSGQPYDLVWCAQGLYSLPDPVIALRQMASRVRSGAVVAVLENDTLHQLLVPLPSRLELELRLAERQALKNDSKTVDKFYVGRELPSVLAEAGLIPEGFHTQTIDRRAPLDQVLELFLKKYFEQLLERTSDYLSSATFRELADFLRPAGELYLMSCPNFTMSWLNVIAWGRKP